tara:strand:- start:270 stop:377 length:108 start_codon:yes stop_codon:yes gene_type:complete
MAYQCLGKVLEDLYWRVVVLVGSGMAYVRQKEQQK